jgi:hypothetical protein
MIASAGMGIHARAGARLKSQRIIEDGQPSPVYWEGGRLGLNKRPIPVSIRGSTLDLFATSVVREAGGHGPGSRRVHRHHLTARHRRDGHHRRDGRRREVRQDRRDRSWDALR